MTIKIYPILGTTSAANPANRISTSKTITMTAINMKSFTIVFRMTINLTTTYLMMTINFIMNELMMTIN